MTESVRLKIGELALTVEPDDAAVELALSRGPGVRDFLATWLAPRVR